MLQSQKYSEDYLFNQLIIYESTDANELIHKNEFLRCVGPNTGGRPRPPVTPQTPHHTPYPTPYRPGGPSFGPDICAGHFDTIGIFRGEMFVFKVRMEYVCTHWLGVGDHVVCVFSTIPVPVF